VHTTPCTLHPSSYTLNPTTYIPQIGASYFPIDAVTDKTRPCLELNQTSYNIPGLLIIDTPGFNPKPETQNPKP
jgi:hypothetical protein